MRIILNSRSIRAQSIDRTKQREYDRLISQMIFRAIWDHVFSAGLRMLYIIFDITAPGVLDLWRSIVLKLSLPETKQTSPRLLLGLVQAVSRAAMLHRLSNTVLT